MTDDFSVIYISQSYISQVPNINTGYIIWQLQLTVVTKLFGPQKVLLFRKKSSFSQLTKLYICFCFKHKDITEYPTSRIIFKISKDFQYNPDSPIGLK